MGFGMIVACVWNGNKYPLLYVERLRRAVARNLPVPHRFVCITDRRDVRLEGIEFVHCEHDLPTWWMKMFLFSTEWRRGHSVLYFDLDSLIIGTLLPLAALDYDTRFGICANFTRAHGNMKWPCKYGSCVMVIGRGLDDCVWRSFYPNRRGFMLANERYGDQKAIEDLMPNATILQDRLPPNYMVSYRALTRVYPSNVSIINFGGRHKPDNSEFKWVGEAWAM